MISVAAMIMISIPESATLITDTETSAGRLLITREDGETLRNALDAVLGPPKPTASWTDLPAQLEAIGKANESVLEDIVVSDPEPKCGPRMPCVLVPVLDEDDEWQSRLPHAERVAEESAIPLADEVEMPRCRDCGRSVQTRLLTAHGFCQSCAINRRPVVEPKVQPEVVADVVADDVPRNNKGETLEEYVIRVCKEMFKKHGFVRSSFSRSLAHLAHSPIAGQIDTAAIEKILADAGEPCPQRLSTEERAARVRNGIARPSTISEPVAVNPPAPVSEIVQLQEEAIQSIAPDKEEPSNTAQVQKEPEIALPSNAHQIESGPYGECPSTEDLCRRQEQKVIDSISDLLDTAPLRYAKAEPAVTLQLIKGLAALEPPLHLAKLMRLSDEKSVQDFATANEGWIAEYAKLPPFKRSELDRLMMGKWTVKERAA